MNKKVPNRPKTQKKLVSLNQRLIQMVNELKEQKGYMTITQTIQQAIICLYDKTFPNYARQQGPRILMSPEERASREFAIEKARKNAKEDSVRQKQLSLATELDAELYMTKNNVQFVRYYTYFRFARYLQELPLEMLTEDLVKNQYQPSKEVVDKLIAEGKVQWSDEDPREEEEELEEKVGTENDND